MEYASPVFHMTYVKLGHESPKSLREGDRKVNSFARLNILLCGISELC